MDNDVNSSPVSNWRTTVLFFCTKAQRWNVPCFFWFLFFPGVSFPVTHSQTGITAIIMDVQGRPSESCSAARSGLLRHMLPIIRTILMRPITLIRKRSLSSRRPPLTSKKRLKTIPNITGTTVLTRRDIIRMSWNATPIGNESFHSQKEPNDDTDKIQTLQSGRVEKATSIPIFSVSPPACTGSLFVNAFRPECYGTSGERGQFRTVPCWWFIVPPIRSIPDRHQF